MPNTSSITLNSIYLVCTSIICVFAYLSGCSAPQSPTKPTEPLVDYLSQANELLKPKNYDPNLNAAPLYERLFTTFEPLPDKLECQLDIWPGDFSQDDVELLRQWSISAEKDMTLFKSACQMPYWWVPYDSQDGSLGNMETPFLTERRKWTFGVEMMSNYMAYKGNLETSLELLLAIHSMAIQHFTNKNLVEQMVGMAIAQRSHETGFRLLYRFKKSPLALDIVYQKHAEIYASSKPSPFYPCEKLVALDWLQRSFTVDQEGRNVLIPKKLCAASGGELDPAQPLSLQKAKRICERHPNRESSIALAHKLYETIDKLQRQTPHELYLQKSSYKDKLFQLVGPDYVLGYGLRAIAQVIEITQRHEVQKNAFSTCLAILRFKADKKSLPTSLEQLVQARYLPELPMDPYSDKALVYRIDEQEFTLYSVASDFKDNAGESNDWDAPGSDRIFWPATYSPPVNFEELFGEYLEDMLLESAPD